MPPTPEVKASRSPLTYKSKAVVSGRLTAERALQMRSYRHLTLTREGQVEKLAMGAKCVCPSITFIMNDDTLTK